MGRGYPDRFVVDRAMIEAQMTSAEDDRLYRSYDSGTKRLDRSLGPGLRAIGFNSLAHTKQWLEQQGGGRKATGLEIAGQGATFAELRMAGIANCLSVPEFLIEQSQTTNYLRRRFARPPITFVPGDIANRETWGKIMVVAQNELPDPPNLILFTPSGGGMASMPERPEFYESVVAQALSLAHPGPVVMAGEMMPAYCGDLERRLLSMHLRNEAQVAIVARAEYGLFALRRD